MSRSLWCCPNPDCRAVLGHYRQGGRPRLIFTAIVHRRTDHAGDKEFVRCPSCGTERRFDARYVVVDCDGPALLAAEIERQVAAGLLARVAPAVVEVVTAAAKSVAAFVALGGAGHVADLLGGGGGGLLT